jgi:hypothetical protein
MLINTFLQKIDNKMEVPRFIGPDGKLYYISGYSYIERITKNFQYGPGVLFHIKLAPLCLFPYYLDEIISILGYKEFQGRHVWLYDGMSDQLFLPK